MVIKSYRRAFSYERRIYKFPNSNHEVPGSPLILSVVYFGVVFFTMLVLGQFPGFSTLFGLFGNKLYVAVPFALAFWGTVGEFDGRRGHQYLRDWLIYQWANRPRFERLPSGWTKIRLKADSNSPELQHGVLNGPGIVDFAVPVRLTMHRGKQTIIPDENGSHETLVLFPGEKVMVKP